MKYARLRIHHTPETRHPMHTFEMEHERIEHVELHHWNTVLSDTNTFVFQVYGDPDPFRMKLASRETTVDYSLTSVSNGVFYCCVRERVTETDAGYIDAFGRGALVVVPPVVFDPDGTTDLTVVGTPADVTASVDQLPDGMRATVQSVGPYRRSGGSAASRLTDRQRAAVDAAVRHGYYDSPRKGAVADVADDLDVAPGTAAEHLRKAEATVMRHAVDSHRR